MATSLCSILRPIVQVFQQCGFCLHSFRHRKHRAACSFALLVPLIKTLLAHSMCTHASLNLCSRFAASSTESQQLGARKWEEGVSQQWEDHTDCVEAPRRSCFPTSAGMHPTILLACLPHTALGKLTCLLCCQRLLPALFCSHILCQHFPVL